MHRRDEINYHSLLKSIRQGKEVTMEQLSEGLCSVSMMDRIEDGRRLPDKLMRDRLMERLGVANDGYEDYLQPDEYALWKTRQDLVRAIAEKDLTAGEDLIGQYERKDDGQNAVERQFYLAMKGQLRQYQDAPEEELHQIYKEAVGLTVPVLSFEQQRSRFLSFQEWDLILEYIRFGGDVGKLEPLEGLSYRERAYQALFEEIHRTDMDIYARVKILPKAAYLLCSEGMSGSEDTWECNRLLRVCNEAIELLRSTGRMYFLSELLEIRKRVAAVFILRLQAQGESGKSGSLKAMLEETEEWLETLQGLFREYGVSERTESSCYLYQQRETYCIGDVVRIRRKMFGMTPKQLCQGICSVKTLRRLENNTTRTQMAIVRDIFDRLGLSPEYQRRKIITTRHEAIVLYDAVIRMVHDYDTEKVKLLLEQLKEMLSMDLLNNRQEMRRLESLNQLDLGEISQETAVIQIKEALEWTIPIEKIDNSEERYLTGGELNCLNNIANLLPDEKRIKYLTILQSICQQYTARNGMSANISIIELIMDGVASYLGNIGEYEKSDGISKIMLKECLSQGRMGILHSCLYNMWWNTMERIGKRILVSPDFIPKGELQKCIIVSKIYKLHNYEKFYRKKMDMLDDK